MAKSPAQDQDATDVAGLAAPSDRSLLRRFRQGQSDAATQLYLRYARRLRALAMRQFSPDLARRIDPDDIVQSVFRTFFRRAAAGQYSVPDRDELWKLFLVIALNKIRAAGAFHRAAKRDVRVTAGGEALERGDAASCDGAEALRVLEIVIGEVLDQLPPGHRAIVEQRIEGCEVAEIAVRAGRAKRSVERVLQEFRKQLAESIDAEP